MSGFSPTGYWAHFIHTDDAVEAGSPRVTSIPVIGTSGGFAQVITIQGRVETVSDAFPEGMVKHTFVNASPTFGE